MIEIELLANVFNNRASEIEHDESMPLSEKVKRMDELLVLFSQIGFRVELKHILNTNYE